jgi:hypothetical protein
MMRGAVKIMDGDAGEILVVRNESGACIEVHIRGTSPDAYRLVRLTRHEARRLAALVLFQAERLGVARLAPSKESSDFALRSA